MPIENFFAYAILRAALFSAASPAERLRSAGSLAIIDAGSDIGMKLPDSLGECI